MLTTFLANCAASATAAAPEYRPVVLMHGLLATSEAMSHSQKWIEDDFPGIHVNNVALFNDTKYSSLFANINTQVDQFATKVRADPKLQRGFNLIGHSQGALIARSYIHRYSPARVESAIPCRACCSGY